MSAEEVENRVIAHLNTYSLSLPRLIQEMCFGGEPCEDFLRSMEGRGLIKEQVEDVVGLHYYQITYAEAQRRKINVNRAHKAKPSKLREALAVLWFCCMAGKKRSRVSRNKLGKEFGRGKGFGRPHCIEQNGEEMTLYRVFVPGPDNEPEKLLDTIRFETGEALAHSELSSTLQNGMVGFAILVEEERKSRYRKAILQTGPWSGRIIVETVPDLDGYANLR